MLCTLHSMYILFTCNSNRANRFGGVMVSVLASRVVDRGFEYQSGLTKNYTIGICCFSAKYAALRSKSKDWLARNQNNVSGWSDMSNRGLLFRWASTIQIQLSVLVYYKADLIIISLKMNLFSPWYNWKIAELTLNNNHSLTDCTSPFCHLSNSAVFEFCRQQLFSSPFVSIVRGVI